MLKTKIKKETKEWLSPRGFLAFGFAFAILVGTLLLCLPVASAEGLPPLPVLDALFTSTSATCVTGLTVIDIGTRLSLFGQITVLALIQLGGLGIASLSTFLLVLFGRRLSMRNEFVLMDAYGVKKVEGLRELLVWTIVFTIILEGIGATALTWCYLHPQPGHPVMDVGRSIYYAVFHSVSAFCHAGFSLHPDNLESFHNDMLYLGVMDFIIFFSSLGFIVLYNLVTIKWWRKDLRKRGKLSLHSKVALTGTLVLIALSLILFLGLEWNHGLSSMPIPDKLSSAFFHAVVPRTSGFNVIPMDQMTEVSRIYTMFLMFIGGSPSSPAGGVKTATIVILLMTVLAMCRDNRETVIFSRTIPNHIVRESIAIFFLMLMLNLVGYLLLAWSEAPMQADESSRLLFEVVSATSTNGMSLNQTAHLTWLGRIFVILFMYIGRIGPLAVVLTIGGATEPQRIHYPEEEIVAG